MRRSRYIDSKGYVRLYRPGHPLSYSDGCVLEHRYLLHEAGVAIPPRFHVHHINGDRQDNRLENLQVMTCSEHARLHKPAPTPEQTRALVRAKNLRNRANQSAWKKRNRAKINATARASYARKREEQRNAA